MQEMICVSPYRELRFGNESIFDHVQGNYSVPDRVIAYLRTTQPYLMSPGIYKHPFKPETDLLGPYLYTYGKYCWDRDKNLSHNAQLTYSLSDSNYVFQAKLTGSRNILPQENQSTMAFNDSRYETRSATRNSTPSLDLYYHQDFRQHQSLTANVVGTLIKTTSETESNEGTEYQYNTDGKTYSLWSEAIYENRLKPFTFSSGFQFAQRYSHNEYHGDSEAINDLHTSDFYLFSQLKGRLGSLNYMAGLGASRRYYRQAETKHNFWLFRPKFSLSYLLADRLKLKLGRFLRFFAF